MFSGINFNPASKLSFGKKNLGQIPIEKALYQAKIHKNLSHDTEVGLQTLPGTKNFAILTDEGDKADLSIAKINLDKYPENNYSHPLFIINRNKKPTKYIPITTQ